jgi:cysteinyl-tRNA synthetase
MFAFLTTKKQQMPPLSFHNTLSGKLELFEPLSKREVKMYNCGPTVYDQVHVGNLRVYILADLLRRIILTWSYKLKQVINITDVGHLVSDADEGEDKIELGAKRTGKTAQEIAREITALFFEDLDALGVDRAHIQFPRATEYIPEQIALIQTLEQKGYAYRTSDGMYFDTAKFAPYGKLGNINLKGLQEGARVEENHEKKSPHDFALWKFSRPDEKRQQEWSSAWGVGFPGWHIECTAMIFKLLGKQIDIHTGGIDHIPVHHQNEIAQAEAATGKQYVRYWLHGEFITIEGRKISKSLGNTIYLHNITDRGFNPRSLRYWFLTGHYRSPMNFTWDALEAADTALKRLEKLYLELRTNKNSSTQQNPENNSFEHFAKRFYEAIGNDLDTPKALALVWDMTKDTSLSTKQKLQALELADKVLGLGLIDAKPMQKLTVMKESDLPDEVQQLAKEREIARNEKDFEKSDELRNKLHKLGYEVQDSHDGQKIFKA